MKAPVGSDRARLTWRDGLSYLLAWLSWLSLGAASALVLQAVRSVIGPLVIALLLKNPDYQRQFFKVSDLASIADRFGLGILGLLWIVFVFLTEDYLRSSVGAARALRVRAASAGATAAPAAGGSLSLYGLAELARRTAVAAAFPAGAAILYGLLQGLLWLMTR